MSHHFARPSSAPTQDISATVSGPPNSFLFADLVVPSPQMLPGDMSSPFIGLSSRLMAREARVTPARRAGSAAAGLGDGNGGSGLPPTVAEETGKGQGHGDALQRLIKKAERRQQHLGRLFLEIVRSTIATNIYKAFAHDIYSQRLRQYMNWTALPQIVINVVSSALGALSLASISSNMFLGIMITQIVLGVIAAVLAGLQKFFAFAERAAIHEAIKQALFKAANAEVMLIYDLTQDDMGRWICSNGELFVGELVDRRLKEMQDIQQKLEGTPDEPVPESVANELQPFVAHIQKSGYEDRMKLRKFPTVLGLKSYFLDVPDMLGCMAIVDDGEVCFQLCHECSPPAHVPQDRCALLCCGSPMLYNMSYSSHRLPPQALGEGVEVDWAGQRTAAGSDMEAGSGAAGPSGPATTMREVHERMSAQLERMRREFDALRAAPDDKLLAELLEQGAPSEGGQCRAQDSTEGHGAGQGGSCRLGCSAEQVQPQRSGASAHGFAPGTWWRPAEQWGLAGAAGLRLGSRPIAEANEGDEPPARVREPIPLHILEAALAGGFGVGGAQGGWMGASAGAGAAVGVGVGAEPQGERGSAGSQGVQSGGAALGGQGGGGAQGSQAAAAGGAGGAPALGSGANLGANSSGKLPGAIGAGGEPEGPQQGQGQAPTPVGGVDEAAYSDDDSNGSHGEIPEDVGEAFYGAGFRQKDETVNHAIVRYWHKHPDSILDSNKARHEMSKLAATCKAFNKVLGETYSRYLFTAILHDLYSQRLKQSLNAIVIPLIFLNAFSAVLASGSLASLDNLPTSFHQGMSLATTGINVVAAILVAVQKFFLLAEKAALHDAIKHAYFQAAFDIDGLTVGTTIDPDSRVMVDTSGKPISTEEITQKLKRMKGIEQKLDGVPNEQIPEPIARQLQPYVTSIQREGLSCRDPSLLHFPPILGIRSFFLDVPERTGLCTVACDGRVSWQCGNCFNPVQHELIKNGCELLCCGGRCVVCGHRAVPQGIKPGRPLTSRASMAKKRGPALATGLCAVVRDGSVKCQFGSGCGPATHVLTKAGCELLCLGKPCVVCSDMATVVATDGGHEAQHAQRHGNPEVQIAVEREMSRGSFYSLPEGDARDSAADHTLTPGGKHGLTPSSSLNARAPGQQTMLRGGLYSPGVAAQTSLMRSTFYSLGTAARTSQRKE